MVRRQGQVMHMNHMPHLSFQMKGPFSGCLSSSFIGLAPLPRIARQRRRSFCKMDEKVDLSRADSKGLPIYQLRRAIFNIANPLPPPVTIARRSLDQDFAVLLLRSGYESVDELNFVAMDRFQQEFFEVRSVAWEKWIQENIGMRQGMLTDPRYFDFISYAQMLTIQKFMRQPFAVFQERYNVVDGKWDTRVVQRDVASLVTPNDILHAFRKNLGNRIYARMLDTVGYPAAVKNGDVTKVLDAIKEAYGYFFISGFCLKLNAQYDVEKRTCTADMVAPAILWSSRALRQLQGIPNDYDIFTVNAFLRASNIRASVETKISGSSVVRQWSLV